MIPKIIHSVWVGPRSIPEQHRRWMAEWRDKHPDFAFMHWDNGNIDRSLEWVRVMLHRRQWAAASDVIRLQILRDFGGIYLDTDVEVVRSLHPLLNEDCVVGWTSSEPVTHCINNAVIAARPGHPVIERALGRLTAMDPWQAHGPAMGPDALRDAVFEQAARAPKPQRMLDTLVVPSRAFYPYYWTEHYDPACVAPDTLCVHHWTLSWESAPGLKNKIRSLPERHPWSRAPIGLARQVWRSGRFLHEAIKRRIDQAIYR